MTISNKPHIKAAKLLITLGALLPFVLPQGVFADGGSISISPQVLTGHLRSGVSLQNKVQVTNNSSQSIHLLISYLPFRDDNSGSGQVSYALSPNSDITTLIKNEIVVKDGDRPISTIDLSPKESKPINISITIPNNIPEQDQYMTILFSQNNTENPSTTVKGTKSATSKVSLATGVHLLLAINDHADTNFSIQDFAVPQFRASGPIPIHISIANDATHFRVISGSLTIHNMFGKLIAATKIKPMTILSKTSRVGVSNNTNQNISTDQNGTLLWTPGILFGRYSITLTLVADGSKMPIVVSKSFIGFPIGMTAEVIILVTILLIVKRRMNKFIL